MFDMAEKLYYSMGEVAEMFDVNPSLIRYWGTRFAALRPKRNKKGNRMFTSEDIETLKLIHHLVKERGMTLDGARKALRAERVVARSESSAEMELLERLQAVRAMLVQVRDSYGVDESEVVDAMADAEPESVESTEPIVAVDVDSSDEVAVVCGEQVADESPKNLPAEEKVARPKKVKAPKSEKKGESKRAKATETTPSEEPAKPAKAVKSAKSTKPAAEPAERPVPFYEQTLF